MGTATRNTKYAAVNLICPETQIYTIFNRMDKTRVRESKIC